MSMPATITSAPYCRQEAIFMIGATIGITTVTGMPSLNP